MPTRMMRRNVGFELSLVLAALLLPVAWSFVVVPTLAAIGTSVPCP